MAAEGSAPCLEALVVRQRRVKNAERNIEPLGESLNELRSEPDFRDQHERALAARQCALDHLHVHLGLAAAGDAVEHERAEFAERLRDALDRLPLFGGQLRRCVSTG